MVRLFVAIDIPEPLKQEIVRIQNRLKRADVCVGTYPREDQLHVTLAFLGEVEDTQVAFIQQALKRVSLFPFDVCSGAVQMIPSPDYIRVIWLDVVSDSLNVLAQKIKEALAPFVILEERPFAGHLTIVRVKKVRDRDALIDQVNTLAIEQQCFSVNAFTLWHSTLATDGSVHEIVERYHCEKRCT